MTPGELLDYARSQYNASNDDFFGDSELFRHAWHAQNILAKEALLIENTYTTPTVVGQRQYEFPTSSLAIRRITWNGMRLTPIAFKEDDWLTGFNEETTATGTPSFYAQFDRITYLRPVPAAVYTLKLYTFDQPQEVSATSVLDVPDEFHLDLVNYLLWKMALKDQNFDAARFYKEEWHGGPQEGGKGGAVGRAKAFGRKKATADGFKTVRDENDSPLAWGVYY